MKDEGRGAVVARWKAFEDIEEVGSYFDTTGAGKKQSGIVRVAQKV